MMQTKGMRKRIFQLILLVWWVGQGCQPAQAQTAVHRFRVLKGDDPVGELRVEQQVTERQTVFVMKSRATFDFLLTIHVEENITDVFENGSLISSSHQRYVNGDLKVNHEVKRNEKGYRVVDHSDRIRELDDSIQSSVLSLYFKEPTDPVLVYSQNFRRLLRVQQTGPHRFRVDLPNGGTTRYTYANGMLVSVESDTYLGTVRFVKEN